jgi:hypothetical protein
MTKAMYWEVSELVSDTTAYILHHLEFLAVSHLATSWAAKQGTHISL